MTAKSAELSHSFTNMHRVEKYLTFLTGIFPAEVKRETNDHLFLAHTLNAHSLTNDKLLTPRISHP